MRSPKNKFLADITTSKPLGELGNSFLLTASSVDELKDLVNRLYVSQAQKIGAKTHVFIKENKKEYPDFDWMEVQKYEI